MIGNDRKLYPVKYTIKSYKAKNTVTIKQAIKFSLITAIIVFTLFITALTLYDMA
jgi:hypothetical protein